MLSNFGMIRQSLTNLEMWSVVKGIVVATSVAYFHNLMTHVFYAQVCEGARVAWNKTKISVLVQDYFGTIFQLFFIQVKPGTTHPFPRLP